MKLYIVKQIINKIMSIQELKSTIRLCIESDGNINAEIFVLLKNQEIKKANFLQALQPEVVTMFTSVITNQLLEADYTVLNASSADERKDVVYYYDLEPTERLDVFQQVQNGENVFPYFSFANDGVNNIDAFLFVLGSAEQQIVLYKRLASVNVYQKRSGLFVREEDNQFTKLDSDVIKIIPQIDAFMINGEIYFMNLSLLENAFRIHDVLRESARQQIALLQEFGLVENIDALEIELENVSFARKFSKLVSNSPVLGKVSNQAIIDFTNAHPALRSKFRYSADGSKLQLVTKLSKKLFIKLLNDDYLTSNLTNQYYDSIAKDKVSVELE